MAAWIEPARAEPAPVVRTRPRPAPRARPQRRMTGSVVWIGALALLLAGVVAMNVTVLRLNMRLDQLGRERADLRAGNAALLSRLSSAAATDRIQQLAAKRLGYVPATPDQTSYVPLGR
jgi:hypothetical protein